MKTLHLSIFIQICMLLGFGLSAQTVKDVQQANNKVYNLVTSYISSSNLTDNYDRKISTFRNLFEKDETPIDMDHIYWFNNSIRDIRTTLDKYCTFYSSQQRTFSNYSICDIKISMTKYQDNKWYYVVNLTKNYTISGESKPIKNDLALHITYTSNNESAKITSVECTSKDKRLNPYILANYIKEDNTPYIPIQLKVLNLGNRTIKLGTEIEQLSPKTYEALCKKECAVYDYEFRQNQQHNHYTIAIKTIKNGIGIDFGFTHPIIKNLITKPLTTDSRFNDINFSYHSYQLGVNYLRQLYAFNRNRISFETGAGVYFNKQQLSIGNIRYNIPSIDADGTNYLRTNEYTDYDEVFRSTAITVPIALRYDYYLTHDLSLFTSIGTQIGTALSKPVSSTFNAYFAGRYGPDLFNLYLDQNGYYDFGTFNGNLTTENAKVIGLWQLNWTASIGIQFHFADFWSVEASASYLYAQNPGWIAADLSTRLTPILYSLNSCLGSPKHLLYYRIHIKYNF